MTLYVQDFESGTNGSAFTWDTIAGGNTGPLCDTAQAAHGTKAVKVIGSGSNQWVQKNLPSAVSSVAFRYYIYQSAALTGALDDLRLYSDTTSTGATNRALQVGRNGNNQITINRADATNIYHGSLTLSNATWYRVEGFITMGASSNATVTGAYYLLDSLTPVESFNVTGTTLLATVQSVRLGKQVTGATAPSTEVYWLDDFAVQDAPSGLIGPAVPTAIPLSGSGTLSSSAVPAIPGTASLSGAGTLSTTVIPAEVGTASLSGGGTLSTVDIPKPAVTVGLSGAGSLTTAVIPAVPVTAGLTGTGTLTAAGSIASAGTSNLSGAGSLTSSGVPTPAVTLTLSGSGTLTTTAATTVNPVISLGGSGSLTTTGIPSLLRSIGLTGSGSLTAVGTPVFAVALSGSGSLSSSGIKAGPRESGGYMTAVVINSPTITRAAISVSSMSPAAVGAPTMRGA